MVVFNDQSGSRMECELKSKNQAQWSVGPLKKSEHKQNMGSTWSSGREERTEASGSSAAIILADTEFLLQPDTALVTLLTCISYLN